MREENSGMRSNWIERYKTPLIWIVALLFFTAVAYRIWNQEDLRPKTDSIYLLQAIVLLVTAMVLIFYTYETYKLREAAQRQIDVAQNQLTESQRQIEVAQNQLKEIQRQIELQLRPFVIFEVTALQSGGLQGELRNIGDGTALNAKIAEDIVVKGLNVDSAIYVDIYKLSYTQVGSIIEAGRGSLLFEGAFRISWAQAGYENLNPLRMLYPPASQTWYKTRIEFQNIEMQGYYVEQIVSAEGIRILDSGRLQSD
jgi:hypothetical protein